MTKEKTKRFTMDIPLDQHMRLKALAALHEKSMRELVLQTINETVELLVKEKSKFLEGKNEQQ